MGFSVRRVVTGHDENGKAVVEIDEVTSNTKSLRQGSTTLGVWSTDETPADIETDGDGGLKAFGPVRPNGSIFRLVEYQPGVAPRNHRTQTIDYAVVVKGEIHMELDDNVVVHLKAGDVLVQRGTVHNWVNKGDEPCVVAFTLIHADAPMPGGKPLPSFG